MMSRAKAVVGTGDDGPQDARHELRRSVFDQNQILSRRMHLVWHARGSLLFAATFKRTWDSKGTGSIETLA